MKKISPFVSKILVVTGLLLGAFAVSAFATDWSAPQSPAPACTSGNPGCDAPVNVGYSAQIKQGNLWLKGLVSAGVSATYGLVVENAPVKASGGLIIETRAADPSTPETGRMWLITP
jgi:hypothetical protein